MTAELSAESSATHAIAPVSEIIAELRAGRMVILIDEEDRENEGDIVMAAEHVTPEAVNFMVTHARGLVCLTLTEDRCRQLNLRPMVQANGTQYGTNFTTSIEAASGVTTGISAADRAHTIRTAVAADAKPEHLVQPGHIFPLQASRGGVLVRAGHTEAGCDLTALAGLTPAAVICEILKDDGTMARLPDLIEFAQRHQLKIGTIVDLIQYRSETESMVQRVAEHTMTTPYGEFRVMAYRDVPSGAPHLALVHGSIHPDRETLVRVHEPTTLIDMLAMGHSGHSWPLPDSLRAIAASPSGVAVLLNCQSDADSLFQSLNALQKVDSGQGAAGQGAGRASGNELRVYGIGAQILKDLGVHQMKLLGRPRRMPSMSGFSLSVTGFATTSGEEPAQ